VKDEPIPQFEHSPFPEGTPHPWHAAHAIEEATWIPVQDTFTPVADSNCPGSANLEPNDRATFAEDK
jgi:hypothetical protein